jgi:hypothetical protein
MLNLDANIVAVALPAIAQSLKADFAAIEWVVSGYTGGLIMHMFGWEWTFYINTDASQPEHFHERHP